MELGAEQKTRPRATRPPPPAHCPFFPQLLPSIPGEAYLVMGIGVPSICQELVNQGLLILSCCLQERFQVHGLQWDLGLWLGEQNRTGTKSPSPEPPVTAVSAV